jgi:hypothetical protein
MSTKDWEQSMTDDCREYRWQQIMDPLCETFQRWKAGELAHADVSQAIDRAYKEKCVISGLLAQNCVGVGCPIKDIIPEKANSGFESPEEIDMNRNLAPSDELQQNLAEERTTWAHERTRLAKARRFAAWLRTGSAIAGMGILVVKVMPSVTT